MPQYLAMITLLHRIFKRERFLLYGCFHIKIHGRGNVRNIISILREWQCTSYKSLNWPFTSYVYFISTLSLFYFYFQFHLFYLLKQTPFICSPPCYCVQLPSQNQQRKRVSKFMLPYQRVCHPSPHIVYINMFMSAYFA